MDFAYQKLKHLGVSFYLMAMVFFAIDESEEKNLSKLLAFLGTFFLFFDLKNAFRKESLPSKWINEIDKVLREDPSFEVNKALAKKAFETSKDAIDYAIKDFCCLSLEGVKFKETEEGRSLLQNPDKIEFALLKYEIKKESNRMKRKENLFFSFHPSNQNADNISTQKDCIKFRLFKLQDIKKYLSNLKEDSPWVWPPHIAVAKDQHFLYIDKNFTELYNDLVSNAEDNLIQFNITT